ncbi:MAG: phenylacetate-CoA ligase [Motiliproteus sp.]|jgi:phenylacetate-CoA ligase
MSRSPSTSLYTQLVTSTLFPLHERLKKHHSVAMLAELERSQWLPPEQLAALQAQELQKFIADLATNNPYYSAIFDELNITAKDISCAADLVKLPFLTKSDIHDNQQALRSTEAGKLLKYNTGGSSGEPLIFYMGMDRVSHDVAAKWRATRWWDVDIGDVEAVIWGSPIELGKQDYVKLLRDRLFRSHLIPAFDLHPVKISSYLQRLSELHPAMVFGYPSVIHQLALAATKQGIPLNTLGVKVVFTTSEMLYPHQREIIEQAFAAPVANGYGARDAGFIAHECPQGSMHISAEQLVVEIIDDQGNPCQAGQEGEIVVTHMATRGFPFVRYQTGDMGTLSSIPCPCGRGLPVMQEVQGRATDFITATDGAKVHALALIYILREMPSIEQFKVIQLGSQQIQIQIKANSQFEDSALRDMETAMKQRLGQDMQVDVVKLNHFPTTKNGKFRYVEDRTVSPHLDSTLTDIRQTDAQ